MLTQISLMPASRRCFGGALCLPRPCVPNTELCVPSKHARHVAALIPSVAADSPLDGFAQRVSLYSLRNHATPEQPLPITTAPYRNLLRTFARSSAPWTSRRAPRVPANTRASAISSASVLFAPAHPTFSFPFFFHSTYPNVARLASLYYIRFEFEIIVPSIDRILSRISKVNY